MKSNYITIYPLDDSRPYTVEFYGTYWNLLDSIDKKSFIITSLLAILIFKEKQYNYWLKYDLYSDDYSNQEYEISEKEFWEKYNEFEYKNDFERLLS